MKINILAIEKYLPKNRISSETLDIIAKGKVGRIEKNTGVQFRHHASSGESVSELGANALKKALTKASLTPSDIDLLIYAGGSFDYPVPHNSVIVKSKITDDSVNFSCFDVDSTCLSFLNALDIAHLYLQVKRFNRIAIVCSETPSHILTPNDEKVFGLFGDAAVAVILECSESEGYISKYTEFKNYPSGVLYANVPIGGAVNRGLNNTAQDQGYYFKMEGKQMIRLTTKHINGFVDNMEKSLLYKISDFDKICTHQASKFGNEFFRKNFDLKQEKVVETLAMYGNCISASIPLGLEHLVNSDYEIKNKKILLLGTGAGLTIGAMVLEF